MGVLAMLREMWLFEMRKRGIPKEQCVFVARKRGNDELAPSEELFSEFGERKRALEKSLGKGSSEAHNRAYLECDYERRFRKQIAENPEALRKLEKISLRSKKEDVYLVCYEGPTKACHRRILLKIAEECFGAKVGVEEL
jgi:uncharacterized protein YeaO (DUF488 family)